eukprot:TRINITY_DN109596_c0_g1_i1.p1 TRINITY_DN109596_c0_g1~~TRINITY_DN109596_c0_g1_i1.p1  ORF type:complete len:496 (-),score=76.74 TRINITY_DN109596_c0_g1_i1:62-1549(-)
MLRAHSTPMFKAAEGLKFGTERGFQKDFLASSPSQNLHLPVDAAHTRSCRLRAAPSLDGGRSPFVEAREPRKETLRLPALSLTRNSGSVVAYDDGGESRTPTPSSQRRRVGFSKAFSAPGSRQSDVSVNIPHPMTAPAEKNSRKLRRSQQGRSVGPPKTVLFEDEEDSTIPPVKRTIRRRKTWNASTPAQSTTCDMMTPRSVISSAMSSMDTPKSSPPQTPAASQSFPLTWIKGAPIGSGSHGCVYKALDTNSGRLFAVKQSIVDECSEEDRKYRERLEEELEICKDLRHPNIVATMGFEYEKQHLYICLEYVPGGSMAALLHEFGPLSENLLSSATSGVLNGLDYLHTREPPVIHRDIKGANILVDVDFNVKLADFGCSKRSNVTTSYTTVGSVPWMAPEVIQQAEGYGRKADMWSLGCVLIEMATAEKPWGKDAFENVFFALRHIGMTEELPSIPDTMNELGQDFARRCLNRDADKRPSSSDLLSHGFVAGAC